MLLLINAETRLMLLALFMLICLRLMLLALFIFICLRLMLLARGRPRKAAEGRGRPRIFC